MKDREPEHNESTDEAAWLDLVARLEDMPADGTHGGRTNPDGSAGNTGQGRGDAPAGSAAPAGGTPPDPAAPARNDTPARNETSAGTGPGADPHRSAAERTRAIFDNQPLRGGPPRRPRDYDEPGELESEGEFVPPEPPPFRTGEPLVLLAWLGALGGPVLLLLFAMFWRGAPLAVILGVIALFVASAGYLLFRLPQHRDDDGAEV